MAKIKRMVIGVYHHDCQTSLSSEKFPGVVLEQLSPVFYYSKEPRRMDYSLLWGVHTNSPSELEEYLRFVKKDSKTKKLDILERGKTSANMLLRMKSPGSSYDTVMHSGVVHAKAVHAKAGYEIYTLLSKNPQNMGGLLNELSSIGDVKIIKAGEYKKGQLFDLPNLTEKQAGALELAFCNGYYTWPRSVTLEELAKSAHISRRSLQERLRRAESKFMPYAITEILRKRF